ncbi:MAG: DUF2807 domain-containing protein [Bacteroidetes bacterium]|nr:DUF2807 domain-containing protein [Bacteroidota bacterium]
MKRLLIFLILAGQLVFSSCSKEVIRGSGSMGNRTLSLPAFTAVDLHSGIKAVITYSNSQEVTATGYDNLLNLLDFKVENGVLQVNFNTNYNSIRNVNVIANIKMPVLSAASIHGSKDIELNGFTNGHILDARIHGSGNIYANNSRYDSVILEIHGSGNIVAQGLLAQKATVNNHGSGDAGVTVAERLKAGIFGSGNIYYWGNPAVDVSRNGSGNLIRR